MSDLSRAKGRYTGLITYLKAVLNDLSSCVYADDCEQEKILGFKGSVVSIVEQCGVVHSKILSLLEPEEISTEVVEHMKCLEPVHRIIAATDLKLSKMNQEASPINSPMNSPMSNMNGMFTSNVNGIGSVSTTHCKLPKIRMPEFSGDPLMWQGFWDQYKASVHNNTNIGDIDKFNYLKGCLKGEALSAVAGLHLSSDNYNEAIELLERRFGNEQLLISAHMESLLKISKVRSRDNVKELRMLYNHVESCMRNLKSLKLDTSGYGSLLIPILKDRLPDEITMIISRSFGNNTWTLDKVMQYFNDELRAQENCTSSSGMTSHFKESNNSRKPGYYTTSNLFAQSNKGACAFCNQEGHFHSKCTNVTSPESRKIILRKNNRCFICLEQGHIAKNCTKTYICRRCKHGKHHISICNYKPNKHEHDNQDKPPPEQNSKDQTVNQGFVGHAGCEKNGILLQTARANVLSFDESVSVNTRILFDSGSQRTYISAKVRNALKLKTLRKEKVIIKTFGQGETSVVQNLDVVQFKVKGAHDNIFLHVEALCVPVICSPLTNQNLTQARALSELKHLQFADYEHHDLPNLPVGILIGIDFYHTFMTGKLVKSKDGPVASETKIGWVLSGRLGPSSSDIHTGSVETHLLRTTVEPVHNDLQQQLQKFWEVEEVGPSEDSIVSKFEEDIIHDGERYVVKLPFKPDHDILPDNYFVCETRLKSLKNRLVNKGIEKEYDLIFREYEQNGIIEQVPEAEIAKEAGVTHYLPHRPVIREDRQTTKIRAVFDASCKTNGPSLNECLYAGPNLIAKIFDILVRFRCNKIGLLADIRQAFLNIAIDEEHRDYLRFLWHDSVTGQTIIYRFLRVVFGVTSSPFLLNGTIRHHLDKYVEGDKAIVDRLKEDFYVDDLVTGCQVLDEGKEIYDKSKSIMNDAGFELRKWVTNDHELQSYISSKEVDESNVKQQDDLTYHESTATNIDTSHKTVLGLTWDTNSDEIVFSFDYLIERCRNLSLTKRNILSLSASIFDPLGMLAPVTAKLKTMFQLLCKDKLGWDELIPKKIEEIWLKFIGELAELKEIRCSRFVSVSHFPSDVRVELHGFCDSSKEVYSAVVYLRLICADNVKVSFIASKTKVAPLKTITIPKLELLGCLLLSKLLSRVLTCMEGRLSIQTVVCWSDSEVALSWIRGKEKTWQSWIENRVVAIRKVVDREGWRYVKSEINPADIPTRLSSSLHDSFAGRWFEGPSFLLTSKALNEVSKENGSSEIPLAGSAEVNNFSTSNQTTHKGPTNQQCSISSVIECSRYSSLKKLILVTGYVMRFVNNLKIKVKSRKELTDGDLVTEDMLTIDEYNGASQMWIQDEQSRLKQQDNYSKLEQSLRLFEDKDGIIRLRGRFANTSLAYEEQYPIILRNKESKFTRLMILNAHEEVKHHGVETTLARIRRNYWIVQGRKAVKEILRKCVLCTIYQGLPMRGPPSPDLPNYRVNLSGYAFQATGLDFAGPLFVKRDSTQDKTYVLLLTCATSRAVHLELVPDMSTGGFLRGFKRFIARRGVPDVVIHDNFKTFKSVIVKRFMLLQGIRQNYILPLAPWWGGFYERLVRSVKVCLKKTLGKSFVTFEELQTILCEVEMVINNRPLAYVSDDDMDDALTPHQLMHGRNIYGTAKATDFILSMSLDEGKRRVLHVRKLLRDCWVRFRDSYMNELRQMNAYRQVKGKKNERIRVGEVCLIKEDRPSVRAQWRKGKVLQLVVGDDEMIRGAKLKVLSKTGQQSNVYRPLQKLIPFEIQESCEEDSGADEVSVDEETKENEHSVVAAKEKENNSSRPRRKAAIEGQDLRRLREQYS